ncbi:MAG TPA: TolC family protein, partial [Flavobacteriaceae bacterium]|nr:TolC family protein [Flavobacteriaceae bacterium]
MKSKIIKLVFILLVFTSGFTTTAQKSVSLEEAIVLASQGNRSLKIQKLEEL